MNKSLVIMFLCRLHASLLILMINQWTWLLTSESTDCCNWNYSHKNTIMMRNIYPLWTLLHSLFMDTSVKLVFVYLLHHWKQDTDFWHFRPHFLPLSLVSLPLFLSLSRCHCASRYLEALTHIWAVYLSLLFHSACIPCSLIRSWWRDREKGQRGRGKMMGKGWTIG